MKMKSQMTLRKLLTLLAALCLLVCLAGCNNAVSGDPTDAPTLPPQTDASTEPVADPTDEPTLPPETEPPIVIMGTVTYDNLNVRSNPSTDSTILGKLYADTRVVIIEQRVIGDVTWGRIADGWINLSYVLIDGDEPAPPTEPVQNPDKDVIATGTVTASELNIRKSGSANAESVGQYKKGDRVEILEVKDGWGRTDKGWVSMKYVKTEGTPDITEPKDDKDKDKETTDKENKEYSTLVTDGKDKVLGYVEIDTPALYVRYGPGTKYNVVTKVYDDERHAYYQEKWGWVRIKDGWISLAYTDQKDADDKDDNKTDDDKKDPEIVSDGKTTVLGYGIVTTDGLNVRTGPGTTYDDIDEYKLGERIAYYQKDGKWIRTKDGWTSTTYVYVEGDKGDGNGSGTSTGDSVNIRSGPGTGFSSVGKVNKGDKVDILAQLKIGKHTWGYTGKGWIRMDYVKMN